MDEELHTVCKRLTENGISATQTVPYSIHYESDSPQLLTKKLRSIQSLSNIKGPTKEVSKGNYVVDFNSRYFTESYPYRLCIVKGFADILGISVPYTDIVLKWYQSLTGIELYNEDKFDGKDLNKCNIPQNYGLYTVDDLRKYYLEIQGTLPVKERECDLCIGVLGGMGTYATIHLFEQYAFIFRAEKEWERPRIIIDNRCTMPSRVRAFLYGESKEQLIDEMTESLKNLVRAGCNRLLIGCNTAHLFLPKIYERFPEAEHMITDIVNTCVQKVVSDGVREVYLLASEGTIESGIYQKTLENSGGGALHSSSGVRVCVA